MNPENASEFEGDTYPPFHGRARSKSASKGFTGEILCNDIHEIIESISLSKFDIALMIKNGSKDGKIIFKGGEIKASICGDLRGQEALSEIQSWKEGYFILYRIFDGILCRNT